MDDGIIIWSFKEAQIPVAIILKRATRAADSVPRDGSIIICCIDDFVVLWWGMITSESLGLYIAGTEAGRH
jgi:hypothetical protein